MKMKVNRKVLEDFSTTRKEFKIYWKGIDPYPECVCSEHTFVAPNVHSSFERRFGKRRRKQLRPYHNMDGNCRYGNSHKSWKNYRETQYIELKNNENLMVKSPCQFICVLEDDVCIGCKRTKEEISKWSKYTDEDKQIVLDRIKTNEEK